MSAETSLGLPYPQSTDNVRPHEDIQALAVALNTLLTLPADVTNFVNSQITITSLTFAAMPTPLTVAFTNPSADYNLVVDVQISAWMSAATNDVRAGLSASGGLTFTPTLGSGGAIANSENLYAAVAGVQCSVEIPGLIIPAGAGAVTFAMQAMRTTSGTQLVSYPAIRVKPRRYQV